MSETKKDVSEQTDAPRRLILPMETLLADYNILRGRLWPLVMVTELVGPWIVLRVWR